MHCLVTGEISQCMSDKTSKQVVRNLEVVSFTPIASRHKGVPVTPVWMAPFPNPAAVVLPYIKVMLFVTTHIQETAVNVLQEMFSAAQNFLPREKYLIRRYSKQTVWVPWDINSA